MKIITPLRPKNFSEFEVLLSKVDERADIVEIWLDGIENIADFLFDFGEADFDSGYQFLGVCKTVEEGGKFEEGPAEKNNILHQFFRAGGDWVDVDVARNPYGLIASIPGEQLWLSFHDFDGVPSDLQITWQGMQAMDPFLVKFAVTTNTQDQLSEFLVFANQISEQGNVIFTTMGELGTTGRETIGGKSWGQFFALDEAHKTASGQKTLDDL